MYTEKQLMEKKPRELLGIVMELQVENAMLRESVEAFSSNQMSEELIKRIIRIVVDDNGSIRKLRNLLELLT